MSLLWLLALWSDQARATTSIKVFAALPYAVSSVNEAVLLLNVTTGLYAYLALAQYSVINRSFKYVPSPLPSLPEVVGSVSCGQALPIYETYSMLSFTFTNPAAASTFLELCNYKTSGPDATLGPLNPMQLLGFVSAQLQEPQSASGDDTVQGYLTVGLSVAVFVATGVMSAFGLRRKMLRDVRGVNFSDLVNLERELQEQFDQRTKFEPPAGSASSLDNRSFVTY